MIINAIYAISKCKEKGRGRFTVLLTEILAPFAPPSERVAVKNQMMR